MHMFLVRIRTAFGLGLLNIGRVLWYRLSVAAGLNPVRKLHFTLPEGPFFAASRLPPVAVAASSAWWDSARYFDHAAVAVGTQPPDWHANPLTGGRVADATRPWWMIPDFDAATGDIKVIWEASRFDWVLSYAQQARNGQAPALERLNAWLMDWMRQNPAYHGPNWKCGQEASIRVMHLAMAAKILGQADAPLPALLDVVEAHLQRIAPTLGYAIAQDNNHGTSEAAALFIGGSWLARCRPQSWGTHWSQMGRTWLENRVAKLVASDGSFSQYSLNYHRVLLDTVAMAEIWRRDHGLPAFSLLFAQRMQAAAEWLHALVRPGGDAPNLGANDGARLLPLTDTPYRDHRPSAQLAMVLFAGSRAWGPGAWDIPLHWLGLALPDAVTPAPASQLFDDGGYACLHAGPALAMLRYPRFRFRPGQADVLHLDLWLGDDNVLRDAGSFGYNTEPRWQEYFPGTAAHNTVQFDGRQQMPRLGRFLFGGWLRPLGAVAWVPGLQGGECAAAYRDSEGATHHRRVHLTAHSLRIEDRLAGFRQRAVLRWRLRPGDWRWEGDTLTDGSVRLRLEIDQPLVRRELVEGWESRHYLKRTALPVLEIEVAQAGKIVTCIEWTS